MALVERIRDRWKDSLLAPQTRGAAEGNWDLTFEVKVHFDLRDRLSAQGQAVLEPQSDGSTLAPRPWTEAQRAAFRSGFVATVTDFWDRRFWFVPDGEWGRRHRRFPEPTRQLVHVSVPNVRCRVHLTPTNLRQSAHLIVEAYDFPDVAGRPGRGVMARCTGPFIDTDRPPAHMICCPADLLPVWNFAPDDPYADTPHPGYAPGTHRPRSPNHAQQIFIAHEFGHYLGCSHVSWTTSQADPDLSQYGRRERLPTHAYWNIMGGGSRVDDWNAFPWAQRLSRHLTTAPTPGSIAAERGAHGGPLRLRDWQSRVRGDVTFETYSGLSTDPAERITWAVEQTRVAPLQYSEAG